MAEPLENLANRVKDDPFFLACALRRYARSESLDDQQLANRLSCPVEELNRLRLCRVPAAETGQFRKDIQRIASAFGLDEGALLEAVRHGQAIFAMSQNQAAKTLLAARDGDEEKQGGQP